MSMSHCRSQEGRKGCCVTPDGVQDYEPTALAADDGCAVDANTFGSTTKSICDRALGAEWPNDQTATVVVPNIRIELTGAHGTGYFWSHQ